MRRRYSGYGRGTLRAQDGMALVSAVLLLATLTVLGTATVTYTSANTRSAEYGKENSVAYSLAEAGVNEAMAVLSKPENNALNSSLLPVRTSDYPTGTVTWSGILDPVNATWTVTSTGSVRNPTGPAAADVQRTLTAKIVVSPSLTQQANAPVWNYIWSTRTGNTCDMTIEQSVTVATPLYVEGNLCLQNTATITKGPLVVKGKLTLSQSANAVGSAAAPISEAHIGNGCQYWNNPYHNPCQGATDNVYATVLDTAPTSLVPPTPNWDAWYLNANPGPYYPCVTTSGTPPTFDNDPAPPVRNNSVPGVFNLTPPGISYTCTSSGGQLSWNATTRVLTVSGTIFIDGSVKVDNGEVNEYDGQATIYLSGTLLIKNSSLCAKISGTSCDTTDWNPNTELLIFVANGNGGQVPAGDSIQLISADFQGGLLGTNAVDIATTSSADGPILGSTVLLGQSVDTSFPFIAIVPAGAPSNPTVYAYPNPPSIYG